jgi:hypothetical protein
MSIKYSLRLCAVGCAGYAAIVLAVVLSAEAARAQTNPCPPPTPSISSSQPPVEVSIPSTCNGNPIAYFDDFSWRSFVAMVWPGLNGQRGVPDPSNTSFPNGVPLVFQTYKADWESFPNPGGTSPSPIPTAWSDFAGTQNPCSGHVSAGWDDMILAASTKFGNLGLAGFGPFLVGPLIVQPGAPNSTPAYVRYQAAYNQTEYDQIFTNKWYLAANIPATGVTFCNNGAKGCPAENSIDVKSSWIDMSVVPAANQSRYYTRQAWLFDPAAPPAQACSQKTVGLVGLHIVSKTPTHPAWIWSTFEQVDNVPPIGAKPPFPQSYYNFHDQTSNEQTFNPYCIGSAQNECPPTPNPNNIQPMPATAPAPFNVSRIMPVPASTQTTNSQYQALLQNTPWAFYQLVMTQWPLNTPPDPNAHCGKVSVTFQGRPTPPPPTPSKTICAPPLSSTNVGFGTCPVPGPGPDCTSFSNVTMETFDQAAVGTGCMNCHNASALPQPSGAATDFLWSLVVNAWPPPSPSAVAAALGPGRAGREKSLNTLRELLLSTVGANEALSKARGEAAPKE